MRQPEKAAGKWKLVLEHSDAESGPLYNVLISGKATQEERRMAVRLLLRRASKSLDHRSA